MTLENNTARQDVPKKSLFEQALEKEIDDRDRARSRASGMPQCLRPPEGLSREEGEAWYQAERDKHEFESLRTGPMQHWFRRIIGDAKSTVAVMLIPGRFAYDRVFGTNVVMRSLISKEINQEQHDALEQIAELYKDVSTRPAALEDMIAYSASLIGDGANQPRTLAECYWWLQLAKHLHLVLPSFEVVMEKALTYWVSPDELDFITPLDLNTPRGKLLQEECMRQSAHFEKILRSIRL